jgi:sugar diacid utilization regulator
LGGRIPVPVADIEEALANFDVPAGSRIGLGEVRFGLHGWRLSHAEARAALELPAGSGEGAVTRGAKRILEIAVLRDSAFTKSLQVTYLDPLDRAGTRSGVELRRTLRAYLAAGHNAKTAAAALGIDRHTVSHRLKIAEDAIGKTIEECHAELQVAFHVEEILA